MKKNDLKKRNVVFLMEAELLSFEKDDQRATIATNGQRHVSQIGEVLTEHQTLRQAISYVESKGFSINTSGCFGV